MIHASLRLSKSPYFRAAYDPLLEPRGTIARVRALKFPAGRKIWIDNRTMTIGPRT